MGNNILCTICARGGSKGVKNKNIRLLDGLPLISYTISQARESGLFDHVVISSDSEEILEVAKKYGADVFFKRPDELASDTAGKLDVIKHAHHMSEEHFNQKFDYHCDLDATSPLRNAGDINEAFDYFISGKYDILISGSPARRSPYFNLVELNKKNKVIISKKMDHNILRRQDAPKCYDMNASIYLWTRESLLSSDTLFTDNTGIYVMPDERSIDIDSELDFKIVEFLMKEKNA